MEITVYAASADVSPSSADTVQVSLGEVDLSQLVVEVGYYELLDEIGQEQIEEYLKDKAEQAEAEEA